MDNLDIPRKKSTMTRSSAPTTAITVMTRDSHAGSPCRANLLGRGRTVIVMTTASRIGLRIMAVAWIPNMMTKTLAIPRSTSTKRVDYLSAMAHLRKSSQGNLRGCGVVEVDRPGVSANYRGASEVRCSSKCIAPRTTPSTARCNLERACDRRPLPTRRCRPQDPVPAISSQTR